MPSTPLHVLVMAGGQGQRLWPLSQPNQPKQFIKIHDRSLLQQTLDRVSPLISKHHTWVVTAQANQKQVQEELGLPASHVLGEPVGRNTATCIALGAWVVAQHDPDAVLAVLPADHAITDDGLFAGALQRAATLATDSTGLVALGMRPTHPATGYGYIELGAPLDHESPSAFKIRSFVEKPDHKTAQTYLDGGQHLWNAGIFVGRLSAFQAAFQAYLPKLAKAIAALPEVTNPGFAQALCATYPTLDRVSFDHGVMEHASGLRVVLGDFGWNDLGDWIALSQLLKGDAQGNRAHGTHVALESRDCVVWAPHKPVVTLGVEGLVIVDTPGALLVCPKAKAQDVRKAAQALATKAPIDPLPPR